MRFLGLVASQGGLFHLPENTFLKKVLQKRLNTKIFISDKPEFCGAIGAGLFAVDSDRLLERLECNALNINPKNLVILIGTNDIGIGLQTEYTLRNIQEILQRTQKLCPNTNIVLQAIYPVNSHLSIIARQMVGKRSNKKILAINIPKQRTFMHLDTVFTMVDHYKFTIHPNIMRDMDVFVIERGGDRRIKITQETGSLEDILKHHLNLDKVTLIKCGSNNVIDSAREQWNDGSNTLAIAPGEVVVYSGH